MNITVVGVGFVGLVTSTYFASKGHNVTCYDIDKEKIKLAQSGKCHFFEDNLEYKMQNVLGKTLQFTHNSANAFEISDIIFLCVGTPTNGGEIDLSALVSVSKEIGLSLINSIDTKTIVIKSTVVPGTASDIAATIEKYSKKVEGADFFIASNPEFLREGTAVWDMFNPDRIIVGSNEKSVSDKILNLYPEDPNCKFSVSLTTAELAKYSSNVFFATLISFSNEIARLCEITPDIDVGMIFEMLHSDRRLSVKSDNGPNKAGLCSYLWPGLGFGGSCFPKDLLALIAYSNKNLHDCNILHAVNDVNNLQTPHIIEGFLEKIKPSNVALFGLSFKPDTDDCRYSKSLEIIEILAENKVGIIVFDPVVKSLSISENITFAKDPMDAISQSDAIIIATSWKEFQSEQFITLLSNSGKPVLDARLILHEQRSKLREKYFGPGLNNIILS